MANFAEIMIDVKPVGSIWILECEGLMEIQLFKTGGEAERSAVRLASALATVGWSAKVVVHDVAGAVAGHMDLTLVEGRQARRLRTTH